jgi:hypothetical protein
MLRESLEITVNCDNADNTQYPKVTIDASSTACNKKVSMTSKYGCPVTSINAIWTFLSKYSYLFGAILIASGLVVGFAGRKLFKPVICFIGALATASVLMLLIYSLFLGHSQDKIAVGWIILVLSIIGGTIVGFILAKLSKLGVAVLAGWGGVTIGFILYSALLYKVNSQAFFWIFIVICAGVCAGLSLLAYDHALIMSTSIIGSYMFIRGISLYAGGYPNEFTLETLIKNGLES